MNAPETLRLPPHSIEAEQSLIGGLLLDNSAYENIAGMVSEADFYRDDHRRIFGHIRRLIEAHHPADVVTVYASIEKANEIDQTGGMGYLGEIANATPSAASVARYARIVSERAKLRRLILAADQIGNAAYSSTEPVEKQIDDAEAALFALSGSWVAESEPMSITQIMGPVIDEIQKRYDSDGTISGLSTGLADIDDMTDGLQRGDLIIIAGRPSMGKSAIAMNIAEDVALRDELVLVFSLEMSPDQLGMRTLASIGSLNSKALRSGKLYDPDWDKMTNALRRIADKPLYIDQSTSPTVAQMAGKARRLIKRTGKRLALVVIDYLQLMEAEGQNRNDELSGITRRLKLMAKDLDCPVICLSQLSRKVEERGDKRPILSDLRESGAIEQDADIVMMMYRDDYYREDSPWAGMAEVLIRKQRNGPTGDVKLVFQKEYSRFSDASPEAIRQAAAAASERKPRGGFRD
jgi:replicative DNA helicase